MSVGKWLRLASWLATGLILLGFTLSLTVRGFTEYWWFKELGQDASYITVAKSRLICSMWGGVVALGIPWLFFRKRPHFMPAGFVAVVVVCFAAGAANLWENMMLATHRAEIGYIGAFGTDASFDVFVLPFIQQLMIWLFWLVSGCFMTQILVASADEKTGFSIPRRWRMGLTALVAIGLLSMGNGHGWPQHSDNQASTAASYGLTKILDARPEGMLLNAHQCQTDKMPLWDRDMVLERLNASYADKQRNKYVGGSLSPSEPGTWQCLLEPAAPDPSNILPQKAGPVMPLGFSTQLSLFQADTVVPKITQLAVQPVWYSQSSVEPVLANSIDRKQMVISGATGYYRGVIYSSRKTAPQAGYELGTGWRRWLVSLRVGERRLLNKELPAGSHIMLRRSLYDRMRAVAPFLMYDRTIQLVREGDRVLWQRLAYVGTENMPGSKQIIINLPSGMFYRFRSVKPGVFIQMDANSGQIRFQATDPKNPLLMTYRNVFPEMFTESKGASIGADYLAILAYGEELKLPVVDRPESEQPLTVPVRTVPLPSLKQMEPWWSLCDGYWLQILPYEFSQTNPQIAGYLASDGYKVWRMKFDEPQMSVKAFTQMANKTAGELRKGEIRPIIKDGKLYWIRTLYNGAGKDLKVVKLQVGSEERVMEGIRLSDVVAMLQTGMQH